MPLPPLTADRARSLISGMRDVRVVVVGDVMLDQFIVGRVDRISPEAPVPVVAFDHEQFRAGGAANVAVNIRALGAHADLVGVVGSDDAAGELKDLLKAADVRPSGLIRDDSRRTTKKVRIVTTRNQQVARIDYESDAEVTRDIEDALADQAADRARDAGAVVVSDYLKGVVTRRLMAQLAAACEELAIPLLVDPKIPHLDYYTGAMLVTPNHFEAETAAHMRIRSDADARRAAQLFRERARCEAVLITRGEHGMWLSHDTVEGQLAARAREVADVTGAGDTVVATLAAAVGAGATLAEAAQLANEAAGIVVGKFGAATVTPEELLARFE